MRFSVGIKPGQSKSEYLISLIHHCNKFIYFHSAPKLQQDEVIKMLNDNPMTQKEIQEHLGIQPPSVSELITKLENKGFVRRERSTEDKRVVRIELTEVGKLEVNHIMLHPNKAVDNINLREEEIDSLICLLESLHKSLMSELDKDNK